MGKKKVVVIGGGFAGIQLVRKLDENVFDVILIDKINHHQFQPLFYQVATSQIEPASISFPFRSIFKDKKNVQIRLANVERIDQERQIVSTTIGEFEYDYLIIAIGCRTNFYGNKNIREKAFSLKTTYDAITIRNHVLQNFEDIISATDEEKERFLNLVIVGAGPTGVELAGAFAEIKKSILPKDFPGIDFSKFQIFLIEGASTPLGALSNQSKVTSANYLKRMGIKLKTQTFVKDYDGDVLTLNTGETIKTRTVIWAAGVKGRLMEGFAPEVILPGNRLKVNRYNQLEGSRNVFAVGDIACMQTPAYPNGHPQVANVAITQAKLLAKNLKKIELPSGKLTEYEYHDLGSMATIGTNKAVVDFPFIHFKGLIAWFIWMFLHLMLILSVRNKLIIFINWAWAYLKKDTSLRLILTSQDEKGN
ncbi:MAG: NAD(P)/FAD-dependent oxidoreductase [Bacteroidota bacterium]|nr:NAD(P)/FAD-dependent oxidoreductase [Bacteroidota bacterium]